MSDIPPQPSATASSSGSSIPDGSNQQALASPTKSEEADVLSKMFARLDTEAPTILGGFESDATPEAAGRAPPDDDIDEGSDVGEVWEDAAEDLDSENDGGEQHIWSISRLEVRRHCPYCSTSGHPCLTRRTYTRPCNPINSRRCPRPRSSN